VKERVLEVERCSSLPWVKSQAQILMINIQMIALSEKISRTLTAIETRDPY
jgi:hypothetical protein